LINFEILLEIKRRRREKKKRRRRKKKGRNLTKAR